MSGTECWSRLNKFSFAGRSCKCWRLKETKGEQRKAQANGENESSVCNYR